MKNTRTRNQYRPIRIRSEFQRRRRLADDQIAGPSSAHISPTRSQSYCTLTNRSLLDEWPRCCSTSCLGTVGTHAPAVENEDVYMRVTRQICRVDEQNGDNFLIPPSFSTIRARPMSCRPRTGADVERRRKNKIESIYDSACRLAVGRGCKIKEEQENLQTRQ